jgi:CRP-like cAMP-binding protein
MLESGVAAQAAPRDEGVCGAELPTCRGGGHFRIRRETIDLNEAAARPHARGDSPTIANNAPERERALVLFCGGRALFRLRHNQTDSLPEIETARHCRRSVPKCTDWPPRQPRNAGVVMDQTFQLFSECALFRHLERQEIEAFFARARIRDFAADETICGIGSPADSMMIVLRGIVQTRVTAPEDQPILLPGTVQNSITSPEDQPILLPGTVQNSITSPAGQPLRNTLSPGGIFGEIALSEGSARLADAIAITDCTLAIIDRHDMLAFLEQNPDARQDVVSMMRERLRKIPVGWEGRQQYADLALGFATPARDQDCDGGNSLPD